MPAAERPGLPAEAILAALPGALRQLADDAAAALSDAGPPPRAPAVPARVDADGSVTAGGWTLRPAQGGFELWDRGTPVCWTPAGRLPALAAAAAAAAGCPRPGLSGAPGCG